MTCQRIVVTGFTDTISRAGQYVDLKEKLPFTLGYDWVGALDALLEAFSSRST